MPLLDRLVSNTLVKFVPDRLVANIGTQCVLKYFFNICNVCTFSVLVDTPTFLHDLLFSDVA